MVVHRGTSTTIGTIPATTGTAADAAAWCIDAASATDYSRSESCCCVD